MGRKPLNMWCIPPGQAPNRRQVLVAGMGMGLGLPKIRLTFPRDAGSHPDFRTEWWYLTGWANVPGREAAFGFQVTFFRSRVAQTQGMRSTLAAKQLHFAHAALTDVQGEKLWHDQRIARSSGAPPGQNPLDTASASTEDTNLLLHDWSLRRAGPDLRAQVQGADFSLDLRFASTQPVLLQGDQGLSRKGPDATQASYYYSLPQLRVQGEIVLKNARYAVAQGSSAWMDHEWSQEVLHPAAVGWDWIGINLFDGSALTAFQLRDKAGLALWDGGSFRSGTRLRTFTRGEVVFTAVRSWRSALSQAIYPVEWLVRTPTQVVYVKAMIDAQELDSRGSTGSIYWEGLCEVRDSNQTLVGRGYLEMTGYATPLKI